MSAEKVRPSDRLIIRAMTDDEMDACGWSRHGPRHRPAVIETERGSVFVPARDGELNGPGHLVELDADGELHDHFPAQPEE